MAAKAGKVAQARDVILDRTLALELARVTERTAIAAARFRGRGDEEAADVAAAEAMFAELQRLAIDGTVVIGEGSAGAANRLPVGTRLGGRKGPKVDIALHPLEGTTICAKNLPNSISVIAAAPEGGFLAVPDIYMDKIAIGPGYPAGIVDLDASPADNLAALAAAKGVPVSEITACILDRPRHARLIEAVRAAGASIRLIGDGDVAGVIHVTQPEETGIDVYLGVGGAPEGILAAAALACIGGQMQGRLVLERPAQADLLKACGITDLRKVYAISDMAHGDVFFAATGVTDGNLLRGVKFSRTGTTVQTVVMRSSTGTRRWITSTYAAAAVPVDD